jgi:cytochrome c553
MATEGLVCGACHHQAGASADDYPVFMQAHLVVEAGVYA